MKPSRAASSFGGSGEEGRLQSPLVPAGYINLVKTVRNLGVWHSWDNSTVGSFQKKWFGALATAKQIGFSVRDGCLSPKDAVQVAEDRLWPKVHFSLELAVCLPNWRQEARNWEATWAGAIIGMPKYVASGAAVVCELGWCDRLVKEIETAAVMRLARIRCLPPQRIVCRAVAGPTLESGSGGIAGSWVEQVMLIDERYAMPDITATVCYRTAMCSSELQAISRHYRQHVVLPAVEPSAWQSWLWRAQRAKGPVPYLFATTLQEGAKKVEHIDLPAHWSMIRMRLGYFAWGLNGTGQLVRHSQAKCRFCGLWRHGHIQHVIQTHLPACTFFHVMTNRDAACALEKLVRQ